MKHICKIAAALSILPCLAQAGPAPEYSAGDKMAVPADYRQWMFLTSSLDLNYTAVVRPGQKHVLDNVFVNPDAYKAFLASGTWPDKTILVKENRRAESAGSLSKQGWFQTGIVSIEIHVKDKARFPGNWAFFASTDGKALATLKPQTANCYSCHQDHGAVDTTFVQFYPALIGVAQGKGTLSPGYRKDSAANPAGGAVAGKKP